MSLNKTYLFTNFIKSSLLMTVAPIAMAGAQQSQPPSQDYTGSTFSEVRSVIASDQLNIDELTSEGERGRAKCEFDVYAKGKLPQYPMTVSGFFRYGVNLLERAAKRTVSQRFDYYPRIEKLVHSNGICFTGEWEINKNPNHYTGYFAEGARGLLIARASAATAETKDFERRAFGFAGKIFPTMNDSEKVETANFFTVDVVPGEVRRRFTTTSLTNEPRTNLSGADFLNFPLITTSLFIQQALSSADNNPGFRPLYPVAVAGTSLVPVNARWPRWMKLKFTHNGSKGATDDFRHELNLASGQQHELAILISEKTKDPNQEQDWQEVGVIRLKESFVSYGCDRRLHFAHPKLKTPGT